MDSHYVGLAEVGVRRYGLVRYHSMRGLEVRVSHLWLFTPVACMYSSTSCLCPLLLDSQPHAYGMLLWFPAGIESSRSGSMKPKHRRER